MKHLIRSLSRRSSLIAFACLASTVIKASAPVFVPTGSLDLTGFQPSRGYFSLQPFDRVDLVNGSLTFTFTDIALPGNAGMDLRVSRTYSHQADGDKVWAFSFTSAPIMVYDPTGVPELKMGDGSTKELVKPDTASQRMTDDFWTYDQTARKLYMPNGWVASYATTSPTEGAMLTKVEDAYGNSLTPTWKDDTTLPKRLDYVVQTVGDPNATTRTRTLTFHYEGANTNLPSSITDDHSKIWASYTYEPADQHRLKTVTPAAGPGWTFDYSDLGVNITVTVTTPSGGTVAYAVSAGRVASITTGGRAVTGGTWSLTYPESGSSDVATATVTTPTSGRTIEYENTSVGGFIGNEWVLTRRSIFDGSTEVDRLTQETTSRCWGATTTCWHPISRQTIARDGVTYTTDYGYSSSVPGDYMQPSSITESASNHSATRVTTNTFQTFSSGHIQPRINGVTVQMGSASYSRSIAYDTNGFATSQTAGGLTTTLSPDTFGNLLSVEDPHGHITSTTHEWGALKTITTQEFAVNHEINSDGSAQSETLNGATTTFTYDDAGRLRVVTPPLGDPSTTTYASDGASVAVTRGPTGVTATVDGFGRAVETLDAAGVKTSSIYDAEGRKTFQSAPFTESSGTGDTLGYDALGRVTSVTHSDSSTITYSYAGGDVSITDENNHTTVQHWQAFGSPGNRRLASVTDATNNTWTYSYNVFGSLTTVHPPEGPDRTWHYDGNNLLDSETQPESGTTTYGYVGGLLHTKTDAQNQTTTYSYDGNHRLTGIQAPNPTESATFTYDDAGNRKTMATGGANTLFDYDYSNRLKRREDHINDRTFVTTYDYDDSDNLTQVTYPSGRGVHYEYDVANQISRVCAGTSCSGTIYAHDLAYHPTGALAAMTFGNNDTETLTLESRFRPYHLVSGPLDVTYGYDPAGNVTEIDDARSDYDSQFAYDELDRLKTITGRGAATFTYDTQGNRHTKTDQVGTTTYTYSSTTNQLTGLTGVPGTIGYDPNGNMTADGTGATFGYSPSNTMVSSTAVSGATTHYGYDASGLRVVKSSPSGVRYYVRGLGSQVLAEYDATSGTPVLSREFVYLGSKLLAAFDSTVAAPSVTVQVTSPSSGLVTPSDVPVTLTADAAVAGSGSISSVQFYANGVPIGSPDTSAPYSVTWTPTVANSSPYQITARAVASTGKIGHAPPIDVTVTAIGRVLGVSVSPSAPAQYQWATVTVTGNGYSCGAVQVDFGDGSTPQTHALSAPLASSPLVLTNQWLTAGTKTITATGQGDCQGNVTTNVTVGANSGPSVSLTAPSGGSIHATGDAITLTATASDADGVASVQFYDGTTLLATDTTAPYSYSWTGASEGSHTIKARAVDSHSAPNDSTPVSITVQDVQSVSVSSSPTPSVGQWALVTVYGAATGCGAVTVNYGDGDVVTYAIDGLPISNWHIWTTSGTKTVTATGQGDCSGSASTTTPVAVGPTITLTSPANGNTFYAPATVTLSATASDSDGSVANVRFYQGSTLLATVSSAPYTYSWSGMANGTYVITAIATDNDGAMTWSSQPTITVTDSATSTVTGVSVSSSSVPINTWVNVTVTGGNPCGAVQINFGDGQAPYLPISELPYTYSHYWDTPGTYTVTASGQGNCGGQASTTITVTGETAKALPEMSVARSDVRASGARTNSSSHRRAGLQRTIGSSLEGEQATDPDEFPAAASVPATAVSLTLDILAGASGTVTSSPSGFNCTGSDTTCTASFTAGGTVTLTATPASGQTFLGWGGACAGTSPTCDVNASEGLLITAAFSNGTAATIAYYHADVVGSIRAITGASGSTVERKDDLVFGEGGGSGEPREFVGAERDPDTAFDYLGARYYQSARGRFASVDPVYGRGASTNPQLWNRYAYGLNNPLAYFDDDGRQVKYVVIVDIGRNLSKDPPDSTDIAPENTGTLGGINQPPFSGLDGKQTDGGVFDRINFVIGFEGNAADYRQRREAVACFGTECQLVDERHESPNGAQMNNVGDRSFVYDNPGNKGPLSSSFLAAAARPEGITGEWYFKITATNKDNAYIQYIKWVITFKKNKDGTWTITGVAVSLSQDEYLKIRPNK